MRDARALPTVACMSRRHALAVVPLAVLVAALVGCTEPARIPPPEPSSATPPLFATDEEALEAATQAYEEYLAVVDRVLQNPSGDSSALSKVAESAALEEVKDSVATFAERGLRVEGVRELVEVEFQQMFEFDSSSRVRFYVCESVAGFDVIGPEGASVVEESRPDLTAFEVEVMAQGENVLVVERAVWADQQFCS